MEKYDVPSAMETDFALEMAANPVLRAIAEKVPADLLKTIWQNGYLTSTIHTLKRFEERLERQNETR